ncbi:MAG: hypothetical protein V2A73_01510 [Pseudomonadota bacterium]
MLATLRRAVMGCILVAATLSLGQTAVAQSKAGDKASDKAARAREHYDQGITHYNLGEFDLAIGEFKKAYAITGASALLFNIAQAYRLKKDYDQALYFYKTYIRLKPDAPNRPDVEARIGEMETLLEESKRLPDAPPRGTIPPGGIEVPTTPTPLLQPAPPAPKPAKSEQTGTEPATGLQPGGTSQAKPETPPQSTNPTAVASVTVPSPTRSPTVKTPEQTLPSGLKPGQPAPVSPATTIVVDSAPPAAAVTFPRSDVVASGVSGRKKKLAGMATAGVGVALLATGAFFGMKAISADADISALSSEEGTWSSNWESTWSDGVQAQNLGTVFLVAGSSALLGGGVLYYLGIRQDRHQEQRAFLRPATHGRGMDRGIARGMALAWSF